MGNFYNIALRYRFFRRVIYAYKTAFFYFLELRYRVVNLIRIRYRRLLVAFILKLWVKEIKGLENVPYKSPCIIVSNHVSYSDFLILAAILDKNTLFVASSKLKHTKIISWFLKLNTMIYVDQYKPGYIAFKKIIHYLSLNRGVVIYPEGTRSRSGKMLLPKLGFVKLALKTGIPILPVAMRGTYKILPPGRHLPRLKRCKVIINKPIYINNSNLELKDIFLNKNFLASGDDLSSDELQEIAIRIMNNIRVLTHTQWDDSALEHLLSQKKYIHKIDTLVDAK